MSQTVRPTITIDQVHLLSVTGDLDDVGLNALQIELELLLEDGSRFLALDLSRVTRCDQQLFDLLTRTSNLIEHRGGWLRLVGLGATVLDTLDDAALPELLLMYRASDWATHRPVR